jgi:hypothetical protein
MRRCDPLVWQAGNDGATHHRETLVGRTPEAQIEMPDEDMELKRKGKTRRVGLRPPHPSGSVEGRNGPWPNSVQRSLGRTVREQEAVRPDLLSAAPGCCMRRGASPLARPGDAPPHCIAGG